MNINKKTLFTTALCLLVLSIIITTIYASTNTSIFATNVTNSSGFDITSKINTTDYIANSSSTFYNLSNDYIEITQWSSSIPDNATVQGATARCIAGNTTPNYNNTFRYNTSTGWSSPACEELYGNGSYNFKCDLYSLNRTNHTQLNNLKLRCYANNESASAEIDAITLDINYTEKPEITSVKPSSGTNLDAGTSQKTISVITNNIATCKYSTTFVKHSDWGSMTQLESTNSTNSSLTVTGLSNGEGYTYYFLCEDSYSNRMIETNNYTFSVANVSSDDDDGETSSEGSDSDSGSDDDTCFEYWKCDAWGPCIEGTKTRSCSDQNSCGTTSRKPPLTADCESNETIGTENETEEITLDAAEESKSGITGAVTSFGKGIINFTKEYLAIFVGVGCIALGFLTSKYRIHKKILSVKDLIHFRRKQKINKKGQDIKQPLKKDKGINKIFKKKK